MDYIRALTVSEEKKASGRGSAYSNLERLAGHAVAEKPCMCKSTHVRSGYVVCKAKGRESQDIKQENRCMYTYSRTTDLPTVLVCTNDGISPTYNSNHSTESTLSML